MRPETEHYVEKYKLLGLLILADLAFIFLHSLYVFTDLLPNSLFALDRDRGYAEFFQYTKELWILVLFLLAGIRSRKFLYIIYSLLFLYFMIDDAFEFHERFGALLANMLHFQPMLGLRSVDFGELLVSLFFGGLFAVSIALVHYGSSASVRTASKKIIVLVILLALFGVLLDMAEIIVEHGFISQILMILEEGGEMVVMSVIAWFTFGLKICED